MVLVVSVGVVACTSKAAPNSDGRSAGDLVPSDGGKLGDLVPSDGGKLGDLVPSDGGKLGDLVPPDGGKLGDLVPPDVGKLSDNGVAGPCQPVPGKICSIDCWCWENPLPQGNSLFGVWGSSASDVFAVGRNGTILHRHL
jgi:hypothetical protein